MHVIMHDGLGQCQNGKHRGPTETRDTSQIAFLWVGDACHAEMDLTDYACHHA